MDPLKSSLRAVESRLSLQLESREKLLKDSRDVITACSRTIISVHNGKLKDAQRELTAAKRMLEPLRAHAEGTLQRYLVSPEAEYVEASSVLALVRGRPLPSIESLGASPEAYLLGLLDTVGELKRLVLGSIMKDDIGGARAYFDSMEEIYSACSPLAVFDHVANGARRKLDVARMLVEDTRGVVTEEVRRESVNASMRNLERKLDRRGPA